METTAPLPAAKSKSRALWFFLLLALVNLIWAAQGTGVKFLAFAIPGALGVLEGGYMVAFSALGLGSDLGLSFTLIRRLRMVLWSTAGLVVLAFLRASPRATAPTRARHG